DREHAAARVEVAHADPVRSRAAGRAAALLRRRVEGGRGIGLAARGVARSRARRELCLGVRAAPHSIGAGMTGLLTVFAQVGGAIPSSPLELIRQATPVTQGVLIVLAALSLISWAVIFGVWAQLGAANRRAAKFATDFDRTRRLDEVNALARK